MFDVFSLSFWLAVAATAVIGYAILRLGAHIARQDNEIGNLWKAHYDLARDYYETDAHVGRIAKANYRPATIKGMAADLPSFLSEGEGKLGRAFGKGDDADAAMPAPNGINGAAIGFTSDVASQLAQQQRDIDANAKQYAPIQGGNAPTPPRVPLTADEVDMRTANSFKLLSQRLNELEARKAKDLETVYQAIDKQSANINSIADSLKKLLPAMHVAVAPGNPNTVEQQLHTHKKAVRTELDVLTKRLDEAVSQFKTYKRPVVDIPPTAQPIA